MTPDQQAGGRFMVALTFHIQPGHEAEAAALIPQEQAHTAALRLQGIVEALYVSADRALVWLVMRGATAADIQQQLATFPLYPYMVPTITALMPV